MNLGVAFGYSISTGVLVAGFLQIVKFTEEQPWLGKIPLLGPIVNAFIRVIDKDNVAEIRTALTVICFLVDAGLVYYKTGTIMDPVTAMTTIMSISTSIATFNLVFQKQQAKDSLGSPV